MTMVVGVLSLLEHARVPTRFTLLNKLHPDVFDPNTFPRLEATAALLSELAVAAEQEAAQATSAKVNAATLERASLIKGRLQRVLEYQLTDEVSVRELDGVRPGSSYKDLATDLVRLAVLAENHPAEIAGDRHFVATDPADARTLSAEILADLGTSLAGLEAESDDTRARVVTLLINDYAELLAALNFVGRNAAKAEQEKRKPLRGEGQVAGGDAERAGRSGLSRFVDDIARSPERLFGGVFCVLRSANRPPTGVSGIERSANRPPTGVLAILRSANRPQTAVLAILRSANRPQTGVLAILRSANRPRRGVFAILRSANRPRTGVSERSSSVIEGSLGLRRQPRRGRAALPGSRRFGRPRRRRHAQARGSGVLRRRGSGGGEPFGVLVGDRSEVELAPSPRVSREIAALGAEGDADRDGDRGRRKGEEGSEAGGPRPSNAANDQCERRADREPGVGADQPSVDDVWVGGVHGGGGPSKGQAVGDECDERRRAPEDDADRRADAHVHHGSIGERVAPLQKCRNKAADRPGRGSRVGKRAAADADRRRQTGDGRFALRRVLRRRQPVAEPMEREGGHHKGDDRHQAGREREERHARPGRQPQRPGDRRRDDPFFRGDVGRVCVRVLVGNRDEGDRGFGGRGDSVGLHGGDANQRVGRWRSVAEDRKPCEAFGLFLRDRYELEIARGPRLSCGKPALGTMRDADRDGDRQEAEEEEYRHGVRRVGPIEGGASEPDAANDQCERRADREPGVGADEGAIDDVRVGGVHDPGRRAEGQAVGQNREDRRREPIGDAQQDAERVSEHGEDAASGKERIANQGKAGGGRRVEEGADADVERCRRGRGNPAFGRVLCGDQRVTEPMKGERGERHCQVRGDERIDVLGERKERHAGPGRQPQRSGDRRRDDRFARSRQRQRGAVHRQSQVSAHQRKPSGSVGGAEGRP
ncbi:hypothetical protein OUZ56_032528 [Daphnia magna]|uniref:Uncharacterized protein n=1 Tax=Daphnia magna TaxID=35525 RepID=A0ABR0B9J4_9CRUS|nr:hypothetical protein OUZ56_032528 [Daphnia magna]